VNGLPSSQDLPQRWLRSEKFWQPLSLLAAVGVPCEMTDLLFMWEYPPMQPKLGITIWHGWYFVLINGRPERLGFSTVEAVKRRYFQILDGWI